MRKVSGFTLIELIAVIAILGILGAIAIPKFFDTSAMARTAAANGIKASIESGAALNYSLKAGGGTGASSLQTCAVASLAVLVTGSTTGWSTTGTFGTATATGNANTCTLEYSAGGGTASATVSVIAVSA